MELNDLNQDEFYSNILQQTALNGGYSTRLDGTIPTDGYMVGITGESMPSATFYRDTEAVEQFAKHYGLLLALDNHYLGTWDDGVSLVYLDVALKIDTLEEAKEHGSTLSQISIFEVASGDVIYL